MTVARPKAAIVPRMRTAEQVAHRLNRSLTTFRKLLPTLLAAGFPPYDELLEGYDGDAVEDWLDRRAGLVRERLPADATSDDDAAEFISLADRHEGPWPGSEHREREGRTPRGQDRDPVPSGSQEARRSQG